MFDNEVADITMAYVIMLARSLHVIDRGVHAGSWPKPAGRSLGDSTLGIIGLGGIGRAVAKRALTAGMRVVGSDPSPGSVAAAEELGVVAVGVEELLATSDFVSVNCPLTPETYHLIDHAAFKLMRQGTHLVNTGRGAVVSTDALVDALRSGHLAGAALDVMEDEPPRPESPLLGMPQVVLGSHNASNTFEASARVHVLAIQNLARELGVTLP
jgi:D-3-phosphoglycerate dehydrogenase / 2-oxoglutarate reductase